MQIADDDLVLFERQGAPALPAARADGFVEHDGARIWHAVHGEGPAVILLHGGLGNAGNWGYQVPALVAAGRTVIVIDSRGHGRSTRDTQPFGYGRMAEDVLAVMDHLGLVKADLAGIRVPVTVAIGEGDEFIRQEHAVYLAQSIPGANLVNLPEVSHFAPLQRPALFNRAVLRFLDRNG